MLHFAYGSNMGRAAMARRCPTRRGVGPARLDPGATASCGRVMPRRSRRPGEVVHGVLWRLSRAILPP